MNNRYDFLIIFMLSAGLLVLIFSFLPGIYKIFSSLREWIGTLLRTKRGLMRREGPKSPAPPHFFDHLWDDYLRRRSDFSQDSLKQDKRSSPARGRKALKRWEIRYIQHFLSRSPRAVNRRRHTAHLINQGLTSK